MVKPGGCAPGFQLKIIDGRPQCVPVTGLPKKVQEEQCKSGWRFDKEKKACVKVDENPCKVGWIYDPDAKACVMANEENLKKKSDSKQCKTGWSHDAITGACVKDQDCKDGHVFNPSLKACVKKVPECKSGWVYDEGQGACVLLDKLEGQACPVDSDFDPGTGACMPRKDRRPLSVIDKVPRPKYSSVPWRYDNEEPLLVSPDSQFIKATYGDLIRSSYGDILHRCGNTGPHEFIVSDGIENMWVGPSKYRASHLFSIAEEIYGRPIINPRTRRPLPEAIGRELMLYVRYSYSYSDESPLIIEGRNRTLYVVEPQQSGRKW